jgi:hypothetical protein
MIFNIVSNKKDENKNETRFGANDVVGSDNAAGLSL